MKFREILLKIVSNIKSKIRLVKIAIYYATNILFNVIFVKNGFIPSAKNVALIRSLVKLKIIFVHIAKKEIINQKKQKIK